MAKTRKNEGEEVMDREQESRDRGMERSSADSVLRLRKSVKGLSLH